MRDLFLKVFHNYNEFYKNPSSPEANNIKRIIKHDLPKELYSFLELDPEKYLIKGSFGVGNPTETPWIAIFDKEITTSAQSGFYVVVLFRKDMRGFYLSLNQGTTYLRSKFKGHKPVKKMQEVASKVRDSIALETPSDVLFNISLASMQQNAKAYEAANIQAIYCDVPSFPSNEILKTNFILMLKNLEYIKEFIGVRVLDQVLDELIYQEEISEVKFQEDVLISKPAQTPQKPCLVLKRNSSKFIKEAFTRDPRIAKESLEIADYQCELNSAHRTFISPLTGKNFMEAHHLVPMFNQVNFKYSLDVPGNIVSLCPNCHREVHHGSLVSKKKIINLLYNKRRTSLKTYGININLQDLIKIYNS